MLTLRGDDVELPDGNTTFCAGRVLYRACVRRQSAGNEETYGLPSGNKLFAPNVLGRSHRADD